MKAWMLIVGLLLATPSYAVLISSSTKMTTSVGDTVVVPIKVTALEGQKYNALEATITYDPTYLKFVKAEVAPKFKAGCANLFFHPLSGPAWVDVSAALMGSGCQGLWGDVFKLRFIAKQAGVTRIMFRDRPDQFGGGKTMLCDDGYIVPTTTRDMPITIKP